MPIRNIERDLYSKKSKFSKRKHRNTSYNEWESEERKINNVNKETWGRIEGISAKNKIEAVSIGVMIVGIFAVMGMAIFGYVIFQKSFFNEDNVELFVKMPEEIDSNKPMEIEIQYKNNNRAILRNANILVSYGQFFTPEKEQEHFKKSTNSSGIIEIGDIPPNTSGNVIILGHFAAPQNEIESIGLELIYTPEKSNNSFSLNSSISSRVTSNPVDVNIITEKTSVDGNMVDIIITYNNKSDTDLENVILNIIYPEGFSLQHAEPTTNAGVNNEWSLKSLNAGTKGQIKLRGVINGKGKRVAKFDAKIFELNSPGIYYGGTTYSIQIISSPLSIVQKVHTPQAKIVSIGGTIGLITGGGSIENLYKMKDIGLVLRHDNSKVSNVVYPGNGARYVIDLKNEGNIPLRDVILTAKIEGEVIDFDKLSVGDNGYFDKDKRLITWKASDVPKLEILNPGDSVSLNYELNINDFLPSGKSNLSISTVAFADSLDLPTQIRENKNASSNIKIVNVGTKGLFNAKISHVSGPNPPVAGDKSRYRITMEIGSINNDLSNVFVKGALPTNVEFVGQKEDDIDEMDINRRTNLFVWNIGNIEHGTGITSDFRTVSFDVNFSKNYTGNHNMILVKDLFGSGYDSFTDQKIYIVSDALNIEDLYR